VTLQCKTEDGAHASKLVLDLKKRKMRWGTSMDYRILRVTKRFITAVEIRWMGAPRDVGSEIWVMNRASGAYWRASIYEVCTVANCRKKDIEAKTYKGVCRKRFGKRHRSDRQSARERR
ncbi:MAG TPA: hypothetical protein VLN73_03495, partial [Alphaproteobacteria bacterium]|nr:hypothetical protein [Alphaproteobacteria bacterium]